MTKTVRYTLKRRDMISLEDIAVGDQVTIRDRGGNLVIGQVEGAAGRRQVKAFETAIPFAQEGRGGKWTPTKGITVVGHLPSMFPVQA